MKTKHTPGTWFVEMGDLGSYFVSSGNTFVVCQIFSNDVFDDPLPPGECKANANLIAAAPDLLEALDTTMSIIKAYEQYFAERDWAVWNPAYGDKMDEIRSVVRKAKGTDED